MIKPTNCQVPFLIRIFLLRRHPIFKAEYDSFKQKLYFDWSVQIIFKTVILLGTNHLLLISNKVFYSI